MTQNMVQSAYYEVVLDSKTAKNHTLVRVRSIFQQQGAWNSQNRRVILNEMT